MSLSQSEPTTTTPGNEWPRSHLARVTRTSSERTGSRLLLEHLRNVKLCIIKTVRVLYRTGTRTYVDVVQSFGSSEGYTTALFLILKLAHEKIMGLPFYFEVLVLAFRCGTLQ